MKKYFVVIVFFALCINASAQTMVPLVLKNIVENDYLSKRVSPYPYSWIGFNEKGKAVIFKMNMKDEKWHIYGVNTQGNVTDLKISEKNAISMQGAVDIYNNNRISQYVGKDKWLFVTVTSKPEDYFSTGEFGTDGTLIMYTYLIKGNGEVSKIDSVTAYDKYSKFQLIRDNNDSIYIILNGLGNKDYGPYAITKIYPVEKEKKYSDKYYLKRFTFFPKWSQYSYEYGTYNDYTAYFLKKGNIILCSRKPTSKTVFYNKTLTGFVVDKKGNYVKEPFFFDVDEYAYAKIRNAYLPLYFSEQEKTFNEKAPTAAFTGGMDFTQLDNGEVILCITALDNENFTSLYLIRFDADGNPVKPEGTKYIEPKTIEYGRINGIMKNGLAYKNYYTKPGKPDKQVKELIIWYIDNESNFYWDKTTLSIEDIW